MEEGKEKERERERETLSLAPVVLVFRPRFAANLYRTSHARTFMEPLRTQKMMN